MVCVEVPYLNTIAHVPKGVGESIAVSCEAIIRRRHKDRLDPPVTKQAIGTPARC